jgi:hypothetical protein
VNEEKEVAMKRTKTNEERAKRKPDLRRFGWGNDEASAIKPGTMNETKTRPLKAVEISNEAQFRRDLRTMEVNNLRLFGERKAVEMFHPTLSRGPARVLFFALRETVKNLTKMDLRKFPERKREEKLEYHHSTRSQDELCRAAIAKLGPEKAAEAGRLLVELLEAYLAEHGPYDEAGEWLPHDKHVEANRRQAAERKTNGGRRLDREEKEKAGEKKKA